jgi:hypothetical protein
MEEQHEWALSPLYDVYALTAELDAPVQPETDGRI